MCVCEHKTLCVTHYIFGLLYLFFPPCNCVYLCLSEHVSMCLHAKCVNFQIRVLLVAKIPLNIQNTHVCVGVY